MGVVSQSSGIGVFSEVTEAGAGGTKHYDGASNPLFRLTAGLTVGPDGLWYGVGAFASPTATDSYVVRFRPQVTLEVRRSVTYQ